MEAVFMRDCGDGYRRADAGSLSPTAAKTAAYTVLPTDAGKMFSNRGATGSVTLTLPAPKEGFFIRIFKPTDEDVVVTATNGAKINGGEANGSVRIEAALGLWLVACDGTDWIMTQEASATLAGLEEGTDGQLIIGQMGAAPAYKDVTGDVTIDKDGVTTIGEEKVLMQMLERGTDGQVIVGQSDAPPAYKDLSGDVTMDEEGVTAIDEKLLQYAEVEIESADITGTGSGQLGHASGYPLVPAPGLNKVLELVSAVLIYDYDTAAYTGGGNVTVNWGGGGAAVTGLVSAANSIGASADKVVQLLPLAAAGNALTPNLGLQLCAAAAFTQPGDAAGVVRVKVAYRVHTTGLAA